MSKTTGDSEAIAFKNLAQLCSRQEKCKSEIRQKLHQRKISDKEADHILDRLVQENYIDEKRYTLAFVNDKIRFNKWGKQKIRYQLKSKNISEQDIANAFSEVDEEFYRKMICKEIEAKSQKTKAKNDWERKGKLMQFAQSRGYESEIVSQILDDLF